MPQGRTGKDTALQIRIPRPCDQDFSAMPAAAGGKYCGQCAQVITDFTKMTDAQLIDWMRSHRGGCGTFRPDQLNRDLVAPVIRKAPFGAGWLLSLLMMTGCIRDEGGRGKPKQPVFEQTLGEPMLPADTVSAADTAEKVLGRQVAVHKAATDADAELLPAGMEMEYTTVTGGVPAMVNEPIEAVPDTMQKRGDKSGAGSPVERNTIDVSSGMYTVDQPHPPQRGSGIAIGGNRSTGQNVILDVPPVRKTFLQRLFGRR